LWCAILLLLIACGARGDPARGAELFRVTPGGGLPCAECHSLSPGVPSPLGPSLAGIAARAGATVRGQPAADYLRESILSPDVYLTAGFQEGIMPRDYRGALSDAQVDDLVAYMGTLR
jgi:mono/diheme cytochrome c family protein